uniref:GC-rich sequence DNA-binding factor 2 n=1 Tax=Hippocampus comes TaxID=109280 RepID=A0A3Q3DLV2_HIPCM
MFNKKTRRIFRQRKGDSSDEEEMTGNSADGAGSVKAATVVPNKPSRLGHCRGISCSSKRESAPSKLDEGDGEDVETATMTADDEENGKDNYVIKKKTSTVLSFSDDKEPLEPEFKLKRTVDKAVFFQVKKKEAPPARNNHNAVPLHLAQNAATLLSSQVGGGCCIAYLSYGATIFGVNANSGYAFILCTVVIPNARMIEAAKRQRRNNRAQKEFIPLDKDGRSSLGSTPEHCLKEEMQEEEDEDRVNDDDDDDDPDDHDRRIEFAPRLKSVKERIAEKLGESVGCLSGSDEEEQELWEETQIEKGVKRRPGGQSPSGSESSSYSSSSFQRDEHQRHKKKSAGLKIPKMLPSVTVSMVKRRIAGKYVYSLKEVHSARRAQLCRMEGDAESAKTSVESLEEGSSEKQLKFYRDMTLFAHNLVECLQEKIVEINSLELELHTLLSSQMVALCAQRQQKIQEHAQHLQQLKHLEKETGKKKKIWLLCIHLNCGHTFISLSALTLAAILLKSQEIFSDVHDDFHDVKRILSRFEEWRSFYSDSYHTAYISLCLPKLLNPIIRQQLLGWNPLKDANVDFEKLPWFTAVETFCHGYGHEELENIDREMLSNVIERTVIPKITAFVELVWDPMSLRQSACLTELCHRLREDYSIFEGEQSKPVTAVIGRLKNCVDEDVFIPLYPKKLLEDRLSPQSQFRNQQFWMAIKLLGNMGKWDPLLPDSALQELMLDKLLCRYLMISLGSQTFSNNDIRACKRVSVCVLPTSWFRGKNECLPQLQSFKNHLVQKAHNICKHQPPEAPDTRLTVVEVLQILSRIRCHDAIMSIAEKYHYEDVIYSHQLLNQETE